METVGGAEEEELMSAAIEDMPFPRQARNSSHRYIRISGR